jgi:hypothetical protein
LNSSEAIVVGSISDITDSEALADDLRYQYRA